MNTVDLLTYSEVAVIVGVKTSGTIRAYTKLPVDPLPVYWLSRRNPRISKKDLLNWLERRMLK